MYFFMGKKRPSRKRREEKPGYFNGIDDLLLLMGVSSASALPFWLSRSRETPPSPQESSFALFLVAAAAAGGTGGTKTKKLCSLTLSLSPLPPTAASSQRHTKKVEEERMRGRKRNGKSFSSSYCLLPPSISLLPSHKFIHSLLLTPAHTWANCQMFSNV